MGGSDPREAQQAGAIEAAGTAEGEHGEERLPAASAISGVRQRRFHDGSPHPA